MSRSRLAALAAALSCALVLGATGTASAQTGSPSAQPLTRIVPITATAKNGKKFHGRLAIQKFVRRGGKLFAQGKMTGRFRGTKISRTVRLPASVANNGAQTAQLPPTPGACQVLNLVLGPIDLNLLGLRVRTNQINLLIEAVPGAGNLLGNLLCGITGILDPNTLANTPLGQLTQILNALLALSPRTA